MIYIETWAGVVQAVWSDTEDETVTIVDNEAVEDEDWDAYDASCELECGIAKKQLHLVYLEEGLSPEVRMRICRQEEKN